MWQLPEMQAFIEQVNGAGDLRNFGRAIDDMARYLGFEYFALSHHARALSSNMLQISNYPSALVKQFAILVSPSDDPIVAACEKTIVGFLWSDIHRLIILSERQKAFLTELRDCGLGEGFTVPIHLPGMCVGSCNFVTAPGKSIPSGLFPVAQYVGALAFEVGQRLIRNGKKHDGAESDSERTAPRLSSRQLDCIALAAQGKSDADAGQLLGISRQTVHHHIEAAKHRYGVATRAQLIVHALFDNQLAFEDVLNRH